MSEQPVDTMLPALYTTGLGQTLATPINLPPTHDHH